MGWQRRLKREGENLSQDFKLRQLSTDDQGVSRLSLQLETTGHQEWERKTPTCTS